MKISLTRSGEEMLISFRGDFTEDCEEDLRSLLDKIEVPSVVFETERVELINSLGAMHWIGFIQSLTKKVKSVRFRKCSPAFIESCATYPKFAPKNCVDSVFLPARCDFCGDIDPQLVHQDQFSSDSPLEGAKCPKCGGQLQPSVELDEYLQAVR